MTTLTKKEHQLLSTFLAHARPGKELDDILSRFGDEAQKEILAALTRLRQILKESNKEAESETK